MKIRTRFAPSPTGYLHIGGARTALFNWLYAKQNHGEFVVRIEDTDQKRSKQEFTQDILSSLNWLGINSDIPPVYQSQRTSRYKEVIEQLLDKDQAYYCYCSKERLNTLREKQMQNKQKPRYDGFCRNGNNNSQNTTPVVRFKNPQTGNISIDDEVRNTVTVDNSELDDLILARSDGTPTYHLCVVVDDIDMQITHVIRGDDHLNNTFRQVNIFNALNHAIPSYAHIPLIHGKDGKRLSKRHGAASVQQYYEDGYLSIGLLNYLIRLGWSHGDQEIFSIDEMLETFTLDSIQSSAAIFDADKLLWVNHQHMQNSSGEYIEPTLESYFQFKGINPSPPPTLAKLYEAQKERCKTLQEMYANSEYFYSEISQYNEKGVRKHFNENSISILKTLTQEFTQLTVWQSGSIHEVIKNVANSLGLKLGNVAPVLRLAVTGQTVSPSIDLTLELLGSKKTLFRIQQAIEYISSKV